MVDLEGDTLTCILIKIKKSELAVMAMVHGSTVDSTFYPFFTIEIIATGYRVVLVLVF